jgi:hypothetical protein
MNTATLTTAGLPVIPTLDAMKRELYTGVPALGRLLDRHKIAGLAIAEIQDFGILHAIDPDDGVPVTIGHMNPNAIDDGTDDLDWGIVRWAPGNTTDVRFESASERMRYCLRWVGPIEIARALVKRGAVDDTSGELGAVS